MADKPYQERIGGSYIRDKDTGKLIPAGSVQVAEAEPATPANQPKKGK